MVEANITEEDMPYLCSTKEITGGKKGAFDLESYSEPLYFKVPPHIIQEGN